jgi:hypothetical protein
VATILSPPFIEVTDLPFVLGHPNQPTWPQSFRYAIPYRSVYYLLISFAYRITVAASLLLASFAINDYGCLNDRPAGASSTL